MRRFRLGAVILILFCGVARGDIDRPYFLSGKVFSDAYFSTQDLSPRPFEQLSTSLWLQGDVQLGRKYSARAIYQGDGFDGNNSAMSGNTNVTHLQSALREGYAEYGDEGFQIRLGKQIIPWGKSDGVNPTDYLSAKDYSFLNPDDETRRLGGTGLWISLTPQKGASPWNVILVTQFIFPQTKLLIPPSALSTGVVLSGVQAPAIASNNDETAVKFSYGGQGWDASFSFFSGWNHQPELSEVSHQVSGTNVLVNLTQVFHRVTALGSDGSLSSGKWVFRGETAYIWTENDSGDNPLIIPSHIDAVLGAERPLGDFFRVQTQVLFRYFPRYLSPDQATGADPLSTAVNQQIAQANGLLSQYQDRARPAGSVRVSYTDEKRGWEAEIFAMENLSGGDYLLRPKLTYSWTDALKSTVGSDYYGGPSNKPLGALKPYNSIFLEAKYTF